jgi:hypothetical protein
VDAFWPQAKLVVELDGYAAHGTRRAVSEGPPTGPPPRARRLRPIRLTPGDARTELLLAKELRDLLRS